MGPLWGCGDMGPYRASMGPYWGLNGALVGLWGHGALMGP